MANASSGILPIQELRSLIERRAITSELPIEANQLQPNSIDLRVGNTAFRSRYSFLPVSSPVAALLSDLSLDQLDLSRSEGVLLETGKVYVIPLVESLFLPSNILGMTNPKSSTGRLDILARVLTDNGDLFDAIPAGYNGKLYLEIVPRAFPIRLRAGDRLAQLRLARDTPAALSDDELRHEIAKHQLIRTDDGLPIPVENLALQEGVFLTVHVSGKRDNTIGYRARKSTPTVDWQRTDHPRRPYWEYISAQSRRNDRLILQPDEFYIFSSRQRVVIPPHLCAEMVPYDAKSGELRTHYAGFFDSGFGMLGDVPRPAAQGARVVLEVRNLDVPFLLQDGQRLFRLRYHRNAATPDTLYGQGIASNYQGQGLRLSKHFGNASETEASQLGLW